MKKKICIILALIIIGVNLQARSVSADEIPKDSRVIEEIFVRNRAARYSDSFDDRDNFIYVKYREPGNDELLYCDTWNCFDDAFGIMMTNYSGGHNNCKSINTSIRRYCQDYARVKGTKRETIPNSYFTNVLVDDDTLVTFDTQSMTLNEGDTFSLSDPFTNMNLFSIQGSEDISNLNDFLFLGGDVSLKKGDEVIYDRNVYADSEVILTKGVYEITYMFVGDEKTELITVLGDDDVSVQIATKDVSLLTTDTFNPEDGFVSMTITTNGVDKTYNYTEFINVGGDVSALETPLKAGIKPVTYSYDGETSTSNIHITDRKLNVKDVNLFEGESYDIEDSYVGLDITSPNGVKTTLTFDEFIALGGSTTSNVMTPVIEGDYQSTFEIGVLTEVSNVKVVKNTVSVIIETNDLEILATESFDSSKGFANMKIITNGHVVNHSYESFLMLGGTSISRVPDPLEAGTYTINYEYEGETGISTIRITEQVFNVKDVSVLETETYSEKDSFESLVVIDPNGIETSLSYDQFLGLGGSVSTTVPSDLTPGEYETVFTLNGVSKTSKVVVSEIVRIVEVFSKPVISEKDKYHKSQGFEKLVITEDGVRTVYGFDEFLEMGGTVTVISRLRMPVNSQESLEVGFYDVVYAFEGVETISRTEIIKNKDPETEEPEVKPEEPKEPKEPEVKPEEPKNPDESTKVTKPKEEADNELPTAGMSSNNTIYIVGGLLILVGGILIVLKKKKK